MTEAQMKANVDTVLDEVTGATAFWTATEVYQALADGQNEVIKELLDAYRIKKKADPNTQLSAELATLLNDDTGTTQTVSIPTGFLDLIFAYFDYNDATGEKPCFIGDVNTQSFNEDNSYLSASGSSPFAGFTSVSDVPKIYFLPTISGTGSFTIIYLKSPDDIASGTEPTLPATTHSAIVNFAVARMLEKDQRIQEAGVFYNKYQKEIQTLLGV